MAKRFIITEEEKGDILSKYGLVNEQNEPIEYKKAVQCFLNKKGYKCFGVDPAKNINQNQNLTIYKDFFNTNFSRKLTKADAYFDIVIGLNVFAHNDSFINMFEATSQILSNEGA